MNAKLDALLKHAGIDPFADVAPDVLDAIKRGEKLEAVKLYRQQMGVTLMQAKDFVEEIQRDQGLG